MCRFDMRIIQVSCLTVHVKQARMGLISVPDWPNSYNCGHSASHPVSGSTIGRLLHHTELHACRRLPRMPWQCLNLSSFIVPGNLYLPSQQHCNPILPSGCSYFLMMSAILILHKSVTSMPGKDFCWLTGFVSVAYYKIHILKGFFCGTWTRLA